MKEEKVEITFKDIVALSIAFFQLALPYTIVLILSMFAIMFLFYIL